MTRRIVVSVLALIVAVLGTVAVPLGVLTSAQDRSDFASETAAAATTLANVAEERIDDGASPRPLQRLVTQLEGAGDRVTVADQAGTTVARTRAAPPATAAQLASGHRAASPATYSPPGFVLVVAPVRNDDFDGNVGVVVLARPIAAVDQRIAVLWWLIASVAAAGLVLAAAVAIGLARWVRRPLADLEAAAQLLGDGDLGARSPAGTGPGEVRRLASNFNLMAARLEALVHGNQVMMADVSHQLRTPLAALRLRLDLLAQDSDQDGAAELAGAQDEISRLSRLVNGLLAVARAENVTAAPVAVTASEVIENRVSAWRPAADEQGIALAAVTAPVRVRMGEGQLEQVLDNLLANALDALSPGARVVITAGQEADRAHISVADNGPGLSDERKRLAFRRFATGSPGGTGLGLAIVHRLAVSNGGSAELSDTEGGGLTVTIELPLASERGQRRRTHINQF